MRDLTLVYPQITRALGDALAEAVSDKLDRYGCFDGDGCVSPVSAESYDGYIAHTNGGFRVMVPCTLRDVESEGMTDFEESVLRRYIDTSRTDAALDFIQARDGLSELWEEYDGERSADDWLWHHIDSIETQWRDRYHNPDAPELPGIEAAPNYCADAEALREEWYEFEDMYLSEGATFFYEIRVLYYERDHRRNNTGADEMYVMSGINTDFEYGRESGLETAIERDIKLARLNETRIRKIVDALADAL